MEVSCRLNVISWNMSALLNMLNTEKPYVHSVTRVARAGICMEGRDGNTPLMQGAPRGQLDLIALREHVC